MSHDKLKKWLLAAGFLLGTVTITWAEDDSPSSVPPFPQLTIPQDEDSRAVPVRAAEPSPRKLTPAIIQPSKQTNVESHGQPATEIAPVEHGGTTQCRPPLLKRCFLKLQPHFLGYPEEFDAPPLGHSIAAYRDAHIAEGEAARMTLYDYDFVKGKAALSRRGKYQLAKIADLLPRNFAPVVIERTVEPELAEARRRAVLEELNRGRFPVPIERVIIGVPRAIGVSGVEAIEIDKNLLNQTQTGGAQVTGGSGGFGSSGATPASGSKR